MKSAHSCRISGTGMYVPEKVVTNEDLTHFIDTSDEWIKEKTGICERRVASDTELPSDFCVYAAREALKNANLSADNIDLIIVALSGPDVSSPATAAIVQKKLGATHAAVFDIRNGCQGFMTALITASKFIGDGTYKNILVIGTSFYGTFLEAAQWRDRTQAVFFGDGSGAVVLSPSNQIAGLLSCDMGNDKDAAHILHFPFGGVASLRETTYADKFLGNTMDGRFVFDFAVRTVPNTIRTSVEKAGLTLADIDWVLLHQANSNIINAIMEELKLPISKTYTNINRYGNTSEASLPIVLHEALREGKIRSDDIVVLCGFGAGMGWGTAVFKWD
ncbi:MAG: ketoacyl-ACP synthase III [Candidatus Roizmanbacteria bacterium]|nr:ketoacyl-ACP synthase III [Candidatus Roizmanbacteria bacterium]